MIEDNQEHIDLINILNRDFNYLIDVGRSISDFKNLITSKDYQLILCDLNLQYQLEGLDILKSFKQYKLTSKIYAYTSNTAEDDYFLEKGFHGVIKKNLNELEKLFVHLLNSTTITLNDCSVSW